MTDVCTPCIGVGTKVNFSFLQIMFRVLRSYLIPGEKDSVVPLSYAKSFSGRVV